MARYEINYLDGNTETVQADRVEYDSAARDYTFFLDGKVVALAPVNGVRSVHRHEGKESESRLVEHARRELALIGEDEWLTNGLCKVVSTFAEMGHSGFSAEHSTSVLERLLRYQPLSPITDDPAEWEDRSDVSGYPIWQNVRDSRAMSKDGGKTYTLVDEEPQDSDSGQPVHRSQSKAVTG